MADNNDDFDEIDEDLLSQIRRWTEKTQQEKAAKAGAMGELPQPRNPWAPPELMAAADRALGEEPQGGPPAPREREAQPVRPAHDRPGTKKRAVRTVLAVLLALVLLLGVGGYIAVFALAGKLELRPIADPDRTALFEAATGTTRVTNILLLGVDEQEGGRTDTMLLLSVDRVHRKLKLTSFLRDSWLPLSGDETGNDKWGKLNTAIHHGGPAGVMLAISKNFGVRVDHYAMVNFSVFEQVVDALGGVSVAITKNEADWLCKTAGPFKRMGLEEIRRQMRDWETDEHGALKYTVRLDGPEALVYCRIRKLDSDFMRTARQRKLMNSLLGACKRNPLRLLGLLGGDTLSRVQTDMTQAQLANLAAMAPLLLGYKVEEFQVPADKTWSYATKQGTSAITMEISKNAAGLRAFIYG